MAAAIATRDAKALRGECGRCRAPALDGSAFCATHGEVERSQGAVRQANRRAKLRAEKRCHDCGCQLKSRGLVRCPKCRKANAKTSARVTQSHARVTQDGADPAPSGRFKLESGYDGYAQRLRYTGRGRHGGVTREEMDEALRIDLRDAIARVEHVRHKGLATLRELEAEQSTHSAKREARILAADPLGVAIRMIAGVLAELHPDKWDAVEALMRAPVEDE